MPKFFSIETENDVKRLSKENYTMPAIKDKLKEENIDISVDTIKRMIKNIGIRRQALSQKKNSAEIQTPPNQANTMYDKQSSAIGAKEESGNLQTHSN